MRSPGCAGPFGCVRFSALLDSAGAGAILGWGSTVTSKFQVVPVKVPLGSWRMESLPLPDPIDPATEVIRRDDPDNKDPDSPVPDVSAGAPRPADPGAEPAKPGDKIVDGAIVTTWGEPSADTPGQREERGRSALAVVHLLGRHAGVALGDGVALGVRVARVHEVHRRAHGLAVHVYLHLPARGLAGGLGFLRTGQQGRHEIALRFLPPSAAQAAAGQPANYLASAAPDEDGTALTKSASNTLPLASVTSTGPEEGVVTFSSTRPGCGSASSGSPQVAPTRTARCRGRRGPSTPSTRTPR